MPPLLRNKQILSSPKPPFRTNTQVPGLRPVFYLIAGTRHRCTDTQPLCFYAYRLLAGSCFSRLCSAFAFLGIFSLFAYCDSRLLFYAACCVLHLIIFFYISLHRPLVRTERDGKATTTRGTGLDSVEQKLATRDGKEDEKEKRYPPEPPREDFSLLGFDYSLFVHICWLLIFVVPVVLPHSMFCKTGDGQLHSGRDITRDSAQIEKRSNSKLFKLRSRYPLTKCLPAQSRHQNIR